MAPTTLFKAGFLLIAGAVITSAVAFACAAWSDYSYQGWFAAHASDFRRGAHGVANHPDAFLCLRLEGFGIRHLRASDTAPEHAPEIEAIIDRFAEKGVRPNRPLMTLMFDKRMISGPGFDQVAAGWPWKAYRGWRIWPTDKAAPGVSTRWQTHPDYVDSALAPHTIRGMTYDVPVPLRPIWYGLLADSVFYGFLIWVVIRAIGAVWAGHRIRRGLCPRCRYPIGVSPVCTECGTPLPARAIHPSGARFA